MGGKRGFFARLRPRPYRPPNQHPQLQHSAVDDVVKPERAREQTPSPTTIPSSPSPTRENEATAENKAVRIVTPDQSNNPKTQKVRKRSKLPFRNEVTIEKAPTARDSAFGGPPRYDWIDIETAAAIKVQAAFRRNKVLKEMEEKGLTTAAMRNRSRRRKARGKASDPAGTEDIPSLFQCCGMGLAFGDATDEDYEDAKLREKAIYEERRKEREQKEAKLRSSYRRNHNVFKPSSANAEQEAFEVLEEE